MGRGPAVVADVIAKVDRAEYKAPFPRTEDHHQGLLAATAMPIMNRHLPAVATII